MAREWGLAPTNGLQNLLDSYISGQDISRKRAVDVADRQQKAAQWEATQGKGLKQSTFDQYGNPNGLQTNEENRQMDVDRFDPPEDSPQSAAITPSPSTPTPQSAPQGDPQAGSPAPSHSMAPSVPVHPAAGPGKAELAPLDPAPLIRDPEVARNSAKAQADAIVPRPGMNEPPAGPGKINKATLPSGMKAELGDGTVGVDYDPRKWRVNPETGRTEIMADRTIQGPAPGSAMEIPPNPGDAQAEAAANTPAIAPQAQPQPAARHRSPLSDYALGRTVDMHTMWPRNAAGAPVDVNNLSPDLQNKLGVTDEMRGQHVHLPANIIDAVIKSSGAAGIQDAKGQNALDVQKLKNSGQTQDPKYQQIWDDYQAKKISYGTAVAAAASENGGNPPEASFYKGLNQAGRMGNSDRTFNQKVNNDQAGVIKGATTAATSLVKEELDGLDASRNVQNMLRQKNTAGLEAKINMMLTRAIAKARVTNMELANMGGLTGVENQANQWFQKAEGEGLTNENKALGLFIAQSLQDEYEGAVKSRIGWVKNSASRQLQMKGMDKDAADQALEEALNPSVLLGAGAQATNAVAPKPGASPQDKYNAAVATLNARTDLNASQKRTARAKMDARLKAAGGGQ